MCPKVGFDQRRWNIHANNTQDDWDSNEESVDEEATHAKVEDRMTNVEEEQFDCSEKMVREGDEPR